MVTEQEIEVRVNPANHSHYSKLFDGLRVGQLVAVRPEQLPPGSKARIQCACDSCGAAKAVAFCDYVRYGFDLPEYRCRKCRLKHALNEKYGVDNVFQLDSVKRKIKETNLDRHGVENVSRLEETKRKRVATNNLRLGVDWPQQSKDVRGKTIETNMGRHGVANVSSLKWVKESRSATNIARTGFEFTFLDPSVRRAIADNNLLLHGVTHSLQREDVRRDIARTNTERYGTPVASRSEPVRGKISASVSATLNQKTMRAVPGIRAIDCGQRVFHIDCPSCGGL